MMVGIPLCQPELHEGPEAVLLFHLDVDGYHHDQAPSSLFLRATNQNP